MRTFIILTILVSGCLQTFAQDSKYLPALAEREYVYVSEYLIDEHTGDTALHVKETYNARGYRTKMTVFESNIEEFHYDYIYRQDSILVERNSFVTEELRERSIYTYNRKNLLSGYKMFIENLDSPSIVSTYTYNTDGRISEIITYRYGDKLSRHSYSYHKNGEVKTVKKKGYYNLNLDLLVWDDGVNVWYNFLNVYSPRSSIGYIFKDDRKRTVKYDENGSVVNPKSQVFEILGTDIPEQMDGFAKIETLRFKLNEDVYYIGVNGGTKAYKGSIVQRESYFNEENLKVKEIEYLNNERIGLKLFEYAN